MGMAMNATGFSKVALLARRDWAEGLFSITLDKHDVEFEPGQFVNLALDIDGARVRRSYSIASAPGDALEFYITRVESGVLTRQLEHLRPGDPVWVEARPAGFFTLSWLPDTATELWMLATGTGLGPFLSMLRAERIWDRFERVVLVHCARYRSHLAYRDELCELERRHQRFRYLPIATREPPEVDVCAGRIPSLIEDGELERRADLPFDERTSHFMLCGNPQMIKDTELALSERGFRKHRRRQPGHVTTEKYW